MDGEQKRAEIFFDALDIAPAVRAEMLLGHRNSYKSLNATLRKIAKKRGVKLPRVTTKKSAKKGKSSNPKPKETTTECPHCRVECVIRGSDLVEVKTDEVHYVGDERCQRIAEGDVEPEEEKPSLTYRFRQSVARVRERLGIVKLNIGFRNDEVKEKTRDFLGRFDGDLDPYVEALIKASLERKKPKRKISITKGDLDKVKKKVIGAEFADALERSRPGGGGEMVVTSETLGPEKTESFLDEGDRPQEKAPSAKESTGDESSGPPPTSESTPDSDVSPGDEGPRPDFPGQGSLFDQGDLGPEAPDSGGDPPPERPEEAPHSPGDKTSGGGATEKTQEDPGTPQGEEAPEEAPDPEGDGNVGNVGIETVLAQTDEVNRAIVKAGADSVSEAIDREMTGSGEAPPAEAKKKGGKKAKEEVAEFGEVEVEGSIVRVAKDARELVTSVFDSDFFEVVKLAVAIGARNHPALSDVILERDLSEAWVEYAKTKMKAKAESSIEEETGAHKPDKVDPNREYFSVSSIQQFIRCPYQWYRRRVLKEIEPPSIALAFGSAFDESANLNYNEKKKTMKDEPDDVLHDKFVESLEARKSEIWYDDNPKKIIEDSKKTGTKLISKFKADVMKDVFPLEVQEKITTPLQGVDYDLFSILDLTTVDGRVVDNKTSARAWHLGKEKQELQRVVYTLAYLAKYGTKPKAMEFHIGVKTKEPKTQVLSSVVTDEEMSGFLKFVAFVVANIRASLKSGVFIPRRDHNLCSTRHCGYFASCEKEWGWRIYEPKKKK